MKSGVGFSITPTPASLEVFIGWLSVYSLRIIMAFKRKRGMSKGSYIAKRRKRGMRMRRRSRRPRSIFISKTPFPDGIIAKLRYTNAHTLSPSTTGSDWVVYNANSVFSPENSGSGHQPMGFDQYALLYNHFIVLGAKVVVTFTPQFSASAYVAAGKDIWAVVGLRDTATLVTTMTRNMEMPQTRWKHVPAASARDKVVISKKFSAKRFFNVSDVKDKDDIGADVTSNPTDVACFHIGVGPMITASATPLAISCTVNIQYIVLFREPKNLTQS